nr:uncharacterized protein CTRU02_01112 [Colletotrichum truncatum]KAF6800707.1 hypothetical protein CTRU02_01112 [Colletotrichum truncatum]
MQCSDIYDVFTDRCRKYQEYPRLQLGKQKPQDAYYGEQQWKNLQIKENILFDSSRSRIDFWETGRLNRFPEREISVQEFDKLWQHLQRSEKDPHVRHLFLESDGSRAPINCSMDMFKLICTYHQVSPSFLESAYTFGDYDDQIDLCLAHFKAKDTLKFPSQEISELRRLGRSGREIRFSYLLRSVEYSEDSMNGVWGWQIRQATNYHSFDVETGRAFWITVKGNDLFQDRIKRVSPFIDIPPKTAVEEGDVSPYLKASLATHIVYLSWCDENWRQYINDVEEDVRKIVTPAGGVLVDDHIEASSNNLGAYPKSLRESRSTTLFSKSQSRSSTMLTDSAKGKKPILSRVLSATNSTVNSWLGRENSQISDPEKGVARPDCAPNQSAESIPLDPRGMLNKFRFKDMQTLHKHSETIQRAMLVLDLNIGVLRDIHDYYGNVAETEFKDKAACKEAIECFQKDVVEIRRMLETRLKQLKCLISTLAQNISLYERVLQQRTNHISTMFAEIAHQNNEKMQDISDKTARQTTSMHVITVATLFFLPATFVAVRATFPTISNLI